MSDIFISYSKKDIALARLLNDAFINTGLETWIDWARIPISSDWWDEICAGILNSDVFLFFISSSSLGSDWCQKEVQIAIQHHKRIIPIVIDDTPVSSINESLPNLAKIQWLVCKQGQEFFTERINSTEEDSSEEEQTVAWRKDPQFQLALQKINEIIHIDQSWVQAHTELEKNANEWDLHQREPSRLLRGAKLIEAENWLDTASGKDIQPTLIQTQYISASRHDEKRQQEERFQLEQRSSIRLRWAISAVSIGLIIAIILSINLFFKNNEAQSAKSTAISNANAASTSQADAIKQRDLAEAQAKLALARQVAAQAQSLTQDQLDLSILLSIESLNLSINTDAKSVLLSDLENQPFLTHILHTKDWMDPVVFSPDGKLLAAGGVDNKDIQLWDFSNQENPKLVGMLQTNIGRTLFIDNIAFSPNGQLLASGNSNNTIQIWDVSNPQSSPLLAIITGVDSLILFGQDGKTLFSEYNNQLQIWDISNPRKPILTKSQMQLPTFLAFSPNGKLWASVTDINVIQLWDASDPLNIKLISQFHQGNGEVTKIAFNPENNLLACNSSSNPILREGSVENNIQLWNISDPQNPQAMDQILMGHTNVIDSLKFSNNGKILASGSRDQTIRLWDVSNLKYVQPINQILTAYAGWVESLTFNKDDTLLVSAGESESIQTWDISDLHYSKTISNPLMAHSDAVHIISFSPDGKTLLSGGNDNTIQFWDLTNPEKPQNTQKSIDDFGKYALAISADGKILAYGSQDNSIQFVDISNNRNPQFIGKILHGNAKNIFSMAFSPDGKSLAAETEDHIIWFWEISDPQNHKLINQVISPDKGNDNLVFRKDGNILVTLGFDAIIRLWNTSNLNNIQLIAQVDSKHTGSIAKFTVSPNGQLLVTCSWDHTIRLWDISNPESPQELGQPLDGLSNINNVAISPDGKTLVSAGNVIRLWDISNPEEPILIRQPLTEHNNWIYGLAFSPDGKYFASGSADDTVRLWNFDLTSWEDRACQVANRNLTNEEWKQYFRGQPYHSSCSNIVTDSN